MAVKYNLTDDGSGRNLVKIFTLLRTVEIKILFCFLSGIVFERFTINMFNVMRFILRCDKYKASRSGKSTNISFLFLSLFHWKFNNSFNPVQLLLKVSQPCANERRSSAMQTSVKYASDLFSSTSNSTTMNSNFGILLPKISVSLTQRPSSCLIV